jgi:hypothetical protein
VGRSKGANQCLLIFLFHSLPLNKTTASCLLPPALLPTASRPPASRLLLSGSSDSVEPQPKLVVESDDLGPMTGEQTSFT